jgi:anti-sigma B factor antagonist
MGRDHLDLRTDVRGRRGVLRAAGTLDMSTAGELRTVARGLWDDLDELVLDLSALEFVDSSGLSALLEVRHATAAAGTRLRVVTEDGPVRSAIEMTGLSDLLAA